MKTLLQNILILFSIISLVGISSCGKVQTEIPAYLKVSTATVSDTNYGVSTSNIYGLNINVGSDNRGRWQLPFSAPVLNFGVNKTYVEPVVKFDNHTTAFIVYPLYEPFLIPLNFESGKVLDTTFVFKYYSNVKLVMYEDNETSNKFTNAVLNTTQSKYGKNCLMLDADINTSDSNNISVNGIPFSLDQSKEVYLEFDYYMPEGVMAPILLYEDTLGTKIILTNNYLTPNQSWTHVYWYLSPSIRIFPTNQYNLGFNLTPQKGMQNATVYIDNIKLLEK